MGCVFFMELFVFEQPLLCDFRPEGPMAQGGAEGQNLVSHNTLRELVMGIPSVETCAYFISVFKS